MNRTDRACVVQDMLVVDGIPLHPLVVHAVVVLLPLATLGAIVIAARRSWRRGLGIPVLLVALAGVAAVPIATTTGEQLEHALPPNPLIEVHADLGSRVLPYAVAFVALLALAVAVELSTGRAGVDADSSGAGAARTVTTSTRARLATGLAVVAALAGVVVTYLVVLTGHAGSVIVWQGIGQ